MKNFYILLICIIFIFSCQSGRKNINDISDASDQTEARVVIEDLEGQTVRTHMQNIDDNLQEVYEFVDSSEAGFTGLPGSVITSGTVGATYIDSGITRTAEIDTAAELETVANLGAYASNILGVTNSTGLLALVLAEDFNITGGLATTGAVDITGSSSVAMGPLDFTSTGTLPTTDGEFRYLSGVTGIASNVFGFGDGTNTQYLFPCQDLPTITGQVQTYNATNDDIEWTTPSGGGDVTASSTTTFTNKTFDASATGNVLSNVDVINVAASTLITSSETGTTATDAQIPTWKAVKDYLDSIVSSGNPSISITEPSSSGTYVDSLTYTAFAGTAFDLQGISSIEWKLESGGTYVDTNVSGTTSWSVSSITLQEGSNALYARVTDTDTSTAEDNLTLIADTTEPIIVADADGTHDGATPFTAIFAVTETNIDESGAVVSVVNATPTSPTTTYTAGDYVTEALTPDGTGTITATIAVSDLAGNAATGTDLIQQWTYSGGSGTLTASIAGSETTGDSLSTGSGTITITGMGHATDCNSVASGALTNDGTDDYFDIQTSGNIDYSVGRIEFNVYPTATQTGEQYRYLFSDTADYHVFCLVHEPDNRLRFRSTNGSVYFSAATSTDLLTQNTCHSVVLTWDFTTSDEATLAIDGGSVETQSMTFSAPSNGANFRVMAGSGGAASSYMGNIDNINIYSTTTGL